MQYRTTLKTITTNLLLFFGLMMQAQVVTVFEKNTDKPLSFVNIASSKLQLMALTNERGRADISHFYMAETISFSLMGYHPVQLSFIKLEAKRFRVYMEATEYNLDEVVVSATRWAQSRRDLTSKISSIRAFEVQLQSPQTAADLLSQSGEVYVQKSQQGGGSPMIRGFSTNRLLISVDGIRMNNAIFRSGNLHNIISIDPFAVEMAEVLFGPGSVIYGSDAIGGVMAFYLLDPKISQDGKLRVNGKTASRYATANKETTGHFQFQLSGNKWASVSSISYNRFGDLRMGKHGPEEYLRKEYVEGHEGEDVVVPNSDDRLQVPTAYNQLSILQKLRYSPNSDLDFLYTFTYSNTTDFDRYDRLIMYRNNLPRSAEWYYGPNLWMMNALSVSYSKPNILFSQATLKLAAQLFEESRHDRNFNASTLRHRYEQVWAYNMQMDFSKEFSLRTRLLYGIDFIFNKINSEGVNTNVNTQVSEEGPTRYPQSDWTSAGAFASLQHRFSAKVLANAGLRYTHYGLQAEFDTKFYPFPYEEASLSNGAINGSIGLVYNPSEKWTFSTNLSTGFRSPNIDDMGKVFDSEPGSVIVPNPALKAEYATNVDLAIAHYIGERIKLDATAFYTWLDDALVRRPFLLSGNDSILYDGELSRVLAIQNAAHASVYGVQAGFEAKLPLGFALRSSLSWQKGEEELDDGSKSPLRHAAPVFCLTKLSYSTIRFRTELSLYYNSEVPHNKLPEEEKSKAYMYALDDNGLPYSPAWYTLNLKSMYKLNDAFTFTAGFENITNQRYRPYSSGVVAAGSNLIFSVIFNF